jgi:hypothetical protein
VGRGGGLLDATTVIHKTTRKSIDTGPFDDSLFELRYEEPGVFVQDDTGDKMIQYYTPPKPGHLEEVVRVAREGSPNRISPFRLALIAINIVVVIALVVVIWRAWRW